MEHMEETEVPDNTAQLLLVLETLDKVSKAMVGVGAKVDALTEKVDIQGTEIKTLKEKSPPLSPIGLQEDNDDISDKQAKALLEQQLGLKDRRNSFLAKQSLTGELDKKLSGTLEEQQVQLLHVQKNVSESMQVDRVSIPDLIKALEFQSAFVYNYGQAKALIFFFKLAAIEEMCENEHRLGSDLSTFLTPSTIYTLPDKSIIKIVARTVRSKYCIERDGLARTVMSFSKTLKAKNPLWKFGIIQFDRQLHPALVQWIRETKRGWSYLTEGATEEEMKTWPVERFGSKDEPQLLRIFAEGLGAFKGDFMRLWTERKTKQMDKVSDFFIQLEDTAAQLCDKAMQFRIDDAANREPTPLDKLREQLESTPRYTRVAQRPNFSTEVDSHGNPTKVAFHGKSDSRPLEFGKPGYPEMPRYGSSSRDFTPRQGSYNNHTPRRIAALTEYDEDDSILDQYAAVAPERCLLQPEPNEEYENDEGSFDVNLSALMRGAPSPYNPTKTTAAVDPNKPCFIHFNVGCDGRCGGYSHDEAAMEKKAYDQLAELLKSRFGGRERTTRNMEKILAGMGATQSSPGPYVKNYSSTKPRQALITGDPESHPGFLRPIAGETETEAAPADY